MSKLMNKCSLTLTRSLLKTTKPYRLPFLSNLCCRKRRKTINMAEPMEVGWYSAPNLRSTMDLVWACAFTIFICTWTALHLNVPPYRSTFGWRLWYKFRLMLVAVLAPEYMAGIALTELRTAVALTKHLRLRGLETWTVKQSFFVGMGGYVIECDNRYRPLELDTLISLLSVGLIRIAEPDEKSGIGSMDHSTISPASPASEKPFGLTRSRALHTIQSSEDVVVLPRVFPEDIDARSKADYMLKAISCGQITWLVVQSIGRCIQSLALSALETTTIAYVACALFAYVAWWKKPYELQSPTIISIAPNHPITHYLSSTPPHVPFNDDPAIHLDKKVYWTYVGVSTVMLLTYSGLHFLAWNLHFATRVERQLWRWLTLPLISLHTFFIVISLLTEARMSTPRGTDMCTATWLWLFDLIVRPVVPRRAYPFCRSIYLLGNVREDKVPRWQMIVPILFLTLSYTMIRVFLLVEAFVGLRQVPMSLYVTVNWNKFFPHVG